MAAKGVVFESEGGLGQPTRHPIDWRSPDFYDEDLLNQELERVFDICHGCRRCVNLCNAFPTLFDLVDESATMEVDGVAKEDYTKVVKECYLCDLCFMTKCPYVPPHEWNVDFPHLMLRAKAVSFKKGKVAWGHRMITSTDLVGQIAGIPVVREFINKAADRPFVRKRLGLHRDAALPVYRGDPLKQRRKSDAEKLQHSGAGAKAALFSTCYNNMESGFNDDLLQILEHNEVVTALMTRENCCGMPKLELGDLESVERLKRKNLPRLMKWVEQGFDIIATVPSCVLMFKQELPLMFPDDDDLKRVSKHIFDPAVYLMRLHEAGQFKLDFKQPLGKVAYHAACHARVQNLGLKVPELLNLVPDTEVSVIERCSGHDGTYAMKEESYDAAAKICRPAARMLSQQQYDHFTGDCALAGQYIASKDSNGARYIHPMSLLKIAYRI